jgi:hypothetical protein
VSLPFLSAKTLLGDSCWTSTFFSLSSMDFGHVEQLDARQSTFNQAGRDIIHYHIHISPLESSSKAHYITINNGNNLSRPTSCPDSLSRPSHLVCLSSDAAPDVDSTTGLIDQITRFIHADRRSSSNKRHDLTIELESLHQTVTLTKLTVQRYNGTPLGQSLANMINPEIRLCSATLQKFLDIVKVTCLDFSSTSIRGLLCRIWWGKWDDHELPALRGILSDKRQLLQGLLVTMHSYVAHVLILHHPLKCLCIRWSM